jgi:hypothetical protein
MRHSAVESERPGPLPMVDGNGLEGPKDAWCNLLDAQVRRPCERLQAG